MDKKIGLAASSIDQKQQSTPQDIIMQLVELLKQGVTIDELIQKNIPKELIQAAVEVVSRQQQQITQVPPEQAGLAAKMVQGEL